MNNSEFLSNIYQNTQMAIQSIKDMYPKFKSASLKKLMQNEEKNYKDFKEQCLKLANDKKYDLKDNNIFQKTMLWSSINFSTLTDKSSSHIAELFLLGTVRGTLKLYKDTKSNSKIDKDLTDLALKLLNFEEESFERIKKYLKE